MKSSQKAILRFALLGTLFAAISHRTFSQEAVDNLEQEFRNPPVSAKPRVWWHWMSGNVSKDGITADLEWMHRVGIGGMQMFDGDLGVARYVDKPVIWMTPEWKDAFRHAGAEAERLGLEMS